MRRRWRRYRANPRSNRLLSLAAILAAGGLAFTGALLRSQLERGTSAHSFAFLFNAAALIAGIAAAIFEARYADLLSDAAPGMIRRGGVIRLLLGIAVCVMGCTLMGFIDDDDMGRGIPAGLVQASLFVGFALGVCGGLSLAVGDGARYAAEKVQERLEDDY